MIFALIGNQNCGKTTLFNQMTGSNQHVGNFPGVTVDQKMGKFTTASVDGTVVDLPGIGEMKCFFHGDIRTLDYFDIAFMEEPIKDISKIRLNVQ